MKKRDYYEVLGLSKGSSEADVKKAYRRLARKLHPDVNPGDKGAQKKFQEVQEAYEVLKDAEKRRAYDRFGHAGPGPGFDPSAGAPGGFPGGGSPFDAYGYQTADLSDLFGNIFGGGGRRGRSQPEGGEDAAGTIEIPFRDAVLGGMASLAIRRDRACEKCGGTGRLGRNVCPTCRGTGHVAQSETLKIKIPEGTENGGTIRIPKKGSDGVLGGPTGDLYVTVRVTPHPYFERQGHDIHGEVPITVKEAYAGGEIEVPTIHGPVLAKIPPGTQSRQKFRLRGKGVRSPRGDSTGDHIYVVRVMVPRTLTPAGSDAGTLLESLYDGPVRKDLPKGL